MRTRPDTLRLEARAGLSRVCAKDFFGVCPPSIGQARGKAKNSPKIPLAEPPPLSEAPDRAAAADTRWVSRMSSRLDINEFRGERNLQLVVERILPETFPE